ncbi:MAG TPA: DNA-binding domain-containing protein [Reyranella sp.]|nr:DNA-binding domain-containing protein [Reyranella sp.]
MSLSLRELQAAVAAHLDGQASAVLDELVIGPAARLRVHRHHVRDSLATALAATFPTVQALVGEDFFKGMARAYVGGALPTQPVLAEYGESFADFVGAYEPARRLAYLTDTARLDWALNVAFHAASTPRLSTADLSAVEVEQLPGRGLFMAPGSALIRSAYPIDRIWAAAQPGAAGGTVDLAEGAACLLVLRRPDDAGFIRLSEGEAAFVSALASGAPLEGAAEAAFAVEPGFELSAVFARLLAVGAFAALR